MSDPNWHDSPSIWILSSISTAKCRRRGRLAALPTRVLEWIPTKFMTRCSRDAEVPVGATKCALRVPPKSRWQWTYRGRSPMLSMSRRYSSTLKFRRSCSKRIWVRCGTVRHSSMISWKSEYEDICVNVSDRRLENRRKGVRRRKKSSVRPDVSSSSDSRMDKIRSAMTEMYWSKTGVARPGGCDTPPPQ
jgi:hypothetical protein